LVAFTITPECSASNLNPFSNSSADPTVYPPSCIYTSAVTRSFDPSSTACGGGLDLDDGRFLILRQIVEPENLQVVSALLVEVDVTAEMQGWVGLEEGLELLVGR
jgi:hypothetical protein